MTIASEPSGIAHSAPRTRHSAPDYLVVGHITKDLLPDGGFAFGGTVTYASLTAYRLGHRTAVLTVGEPSPALTQQFDGVALRCVPSPVTTTFENRYGGGRRTQYLRAVAPPFRPDDVPLAWRSTPIVHLGPVAQEIPLEVAEVFDAEALLGITPQGWLRTWDATGLVRPAPWASAERLLARADVLIFSEHDVGGDTALVRRYVQLARVAVVTQNIRGATVHWDYGAHRHDVPAFPATEVDPTGAGDVFAAAFLLNYADTRDPVACTRYANCVASFAVEGQGTSTLPDPQHLEARWRSARI